MDCQRGSRAAGGPGRPSRTGPGERGYLRESGKAVSGGNRVEILGGSPAGTGNPAGGGYMVAWKRTGYMKILIIYMSYHQMNTEKVARAMAEAAGATLAKADEIQPEALAGYDLVGFGSGIYGGKHHTSLLALADEMPPMEKPVFLFSTSGAYKEEYHTPMRRKVITKGCQIVKEFHCKGESRFLGFIRLNKGHPDEKDLESAREFGRALLVR